MNKAFYIIVLLLLCGLATKAQLILGTNIVQNPSFEQYDTCPNNGGELHYANYWWGMSTEYFNACATISSGVSIPSNFAGFQYANNGNAYSGFIIYGYDYTVPNNEYKESIKTKLKDSLNINKRYCTNFYMSLAEYSYLYNINMIFLDSTGILFTKDPVIDYISVVFPLGIKVQNAITNLDTISWLKITNTFVAKGREQYLTIGNFDNIIYPSQAKVSTYVYVDDVSVCECSFNFSLGNDTNLCIGESLILKPNMPNATYTWQDGSTNSTYTVTQPGTYWVKAYFADYRITTTDTIYIMYKDCDTISPNTFTPGIYIPSAFSPIGYNNIFKVVTIAEFSEFKMEIYYRWYGMAFESEDKNKGWDGTYRGKPVPSGVYLYHITATIKDTGEKIEKIGTVTLIR